MVSTPVRSAIYLRISLDMTGEGLAIARQREECARIVQSRGWTVTSEYVDSSISASDAKKNRPGYNALVRDFELGLFDALVCYDLDRLTRQPRQLEDWIDAAEKRGLALVTANGEADLTTDGGRMFARVKVAVGRSEVDRKSRRQRDAARQRSQLGRPPLGTRLTGYTPKGDVIEDEAEIVRFIFQRFTSGDSLKSIARELTERGTPPRHDRPWNPSTIRGILVNPRYAGRAIYQGKETGERAGWEPLVSDDTFNLVQAKLNDPRRITNRVGTERKHLGSGLFRCAVCDEPLRGFSGQRYRCRLAHVNRARPAVDDFVTAVIAERLRRPDLQELLAPLEDNFAPLVKRVSELRERLDSIAEDYDRGLIDGARFSTATAKVTAELTTAERRLAARSTGAGLANTLAAPDPGAAFLDAPLMIQRSVIDALCTVHLSKGHRYSRVFDPETVRITWRGGQG